RHAASKALLERNDVVVVASVSCIYGLGSPTRYFDMLVFLDRETQVERDVMLRKLVDMQYQRSDYDFHRGTFRVRGDVVEIFPAYEEARAIRVELFGDRVETLSEIDPLRGTVLRRHRELLAPPRRPRPGAAALHAPRLLPRGLPARHRREPRHRATDRRHVPRRPLPKRDAGRVRLPPPVRARQPPAQLRGVHAPRTPDALRLGHPRGVGDPPGPRPRRRAA